jgi:hypothetical protein
MKIPIYLLVVSLLCLGTSNAVMSQEEPAGPATEAGEDLDLEAVAELFSEAEDLESFEKALNDSASEVNNLDLNEDGEVDYIRVEQTQDDNTDVIALTVPLSETESQDVATIEMQKNSDEDIDLQVVGNEEIYGEDYIVEVDTDAAQSESQSSGSSSSTTVIVVHSWPAVRVIWGPGYSPWRSPWRWRHYPGWYRPWRPMTRSVYRSRVTKHRRMAFRRTPVRRAQRAPSIYSPRSSSLAKQKNKKTAYYKQPTQKQQTPKQQTQKQQTQKQQTKKQQQKKKTTTKQGKKRP